MYTSTVTTKGQATIPAPIRKKLGIKPGEKLIFEEKGKEITMKKIPNFLDLLGSIKTKKKYNEKAINKAIGKMLAQRYLKTLSK